MVNNFISINNIEESQLEKNYCSTYYNNNNIIIDIMIKNNKYNPLFMNIYNPFMILL